MEISDNTPVVIPCPQCGHKHKQSLASFKLESVFACSCGFRYEFADQERESRLQALAEKINAKPSK